MLHYYNYATMDCVSPGGRTTALKPVPSPPQARSVAWPHVHEIGGPFRGVVSGL